MKYLAMLLALSLSACSVVGPGQRGVHVWLGEASDKPLASGVYLWIPFVYSVHKIDVQVQKSEITTGAASKDMQEISTDLAINWKLSPEQVVQTYKNIGDEEEVLSRIIRPAVSEVLKAATAQHTAEDILKNRLELKKSIDDGLKARLTAYGIEVFDVSIVHLSFTKGFEQAVEEKQIAEQKAKQAAYDASRATQEAKAEVERAKGTAQSQQLMRQSVTEMLIKQRAVEKWDGHFPQVMGSGALPFLNMKMDGK